MSGFDVLVLGSSGSYASPDNPCTGYLIRTPQATVVLDCGPGTLGPLQAAVDLEAHDPARVGVRVYVRVGLDSNPHVVRAPRECG